MNKTREEAVALTNALKGVSIPENTEVILGVPYVFLQEVAELLADSEIKVVAQNCHHMDAGAYTGEISVGMIKSIGVDGVILGHSERRAQFAEDHSLLAAKVDAVLAQGLQPIFCCGEPLEIREAEAQVEYVKQQIEGSLFHLSAEQLSKLVIAYEPIWAIGTGVTASPEQAQDMHASIRQMLRDQYGAEVADNMSILYGGSVKPGNAADLFGRADVDGGLVGGASLKPDDFKGIIAAS